MRAGAAVAPLWRRGGAIVALAALAACGGASQAPASAPSALLAKPIPDFEKRALAGEEVDTRAMR